MQNFLQSSLFKGIIIGLGCLIILIFVFNLGIFVGTKKADFSFKWAGEYHRDFGGFLSPYGSYGQIISINDNILTVKDNDADKTEKNILIGNNTTIIFQRKNIKLSDLKIGDNIVTIGNPNSDGQIQAELIRVIPLK